MDDSQFQKRVKDELNDINFPEKSWINPSGHLLDVAIIGAGMAGLSAAFALKRLGISHIKIYDESQVGYEGPWATFARMATLRSGKELVGPALDFPLLTFQAWFTNKYDLERWNALGKIPTPLWMEYLRWFREVLELDVENDKPLKLILPQENGIDLVIGDQTIRTKKVILATGRGGFGGSQLPEFINELPKESYADANTPIDFSRFVNKNVAIIGGGASGFDAAAAALEAGCVQVDMLLRRKALPHVNKAASLTYSGYAEGYYNLEDERRWKFSEALYREGIPPPYESVDKIIDHPQFSIVRDIKINSAKYHSSKLFLNTSKGELAYDYLIFATGFEIDISKQPELQKIADKIQLWSDRECSRNQKGPDWFYRSPYLGSHFQFLEKKPAEASFLKHIYCFNHAATLSHGLVSSDIPGIGVGATRLARGIACDFFAEGFDEYYMRLEGFQTLELKPDL